MRFCLGFLLLFVSYGISAQEENSLLWEISGNNLQQSSYLYGTMHVSQKIAFRLDDVFYEALDKSEIVALESDPDSWLEDYGKMRSGGVGYGTGFITKGFYIYPFAIKNPTKEIVSSYLSLDDRLVNNILYRTNETSQNFEEETYLDMFIYQAGKKFTKPIVALEDLEESSALVGRANMNAMKPKPDEWLQKKMQTQEVMSLLQDAYRERNINLIDSLDQAMYTEHYLQNMLYARNVNMVQRMDSLMQTAKVFTGIGAAHLPGKNGVIQLLRNKGYEVKALTSRFSYKGRALKDSLETKILNNEYYTRTPDDALFSILLPNKLYPIAEYTNTTYVSPDLANGSYLMVNRIPTFSYLKKDYSYTLEDVDKLLFENIPGKILEKTKIETGPYPGLDIKNQLKNGDFQRYHIYITPLEILIFKMSGHGDYVVKHSDTIFNSISFSSIEKKRTVLFSQFDDFEVEMPSIYNFTNRKRKGNRFIEGVDPETSSYFFLKKATLNDFNFIEEDTFELKQIQTRFYEDLKLKPEFGPYDNQSLISSANFTPNGSQKLYLKTVFRSNNYYLLGSVAKDSSDAVHFFDSFKVKQQNYIEEFKKVQDTALFFSTVSPIDPPKFVENSNNYYERHKKPKPYSAYTKKSVYQNKNNEAVLVTVNKAHDFLMFPNIDSVWRLRRKLYAQNTFNIIREQRPQYNNKYHEMNLTLVDTGSTRGIMIKNIVKGGLLYEVKALIDTVLPPSKFVNKFFNNFSPHDTLIGSSILSDKTADFFKAIRQNDSIVLDGYPFVQFYKKHEDSLKYYISEFNFKDNQKYLQAHLIQKLAQMQDVDATRFFETYYTKSYNNSKAQTKILQAISKKQNESSLALLLRLMSTDLPLVSSKQEIQNIFQPYLDSLPLANNLFPEIFDYSAIEEYKSPIFSILAKLKARGLIKPKSYKKYKNQILNDAKIQLKRQLGLSMDQLTEESPKTTDNNYDILENYAILLYPFIKEIEVAAFFRRLSMVEDPEIQTSYIALLLKNEENPLHGENKIPKSLIISLAENPETRLSLFEKLQQIGKLNYFPANYRNQQAIAESILYNTLELNPEQYTIEYIKDQKLYYPNNNYHGYYFKVKDKDKYSNNLKMYLLAFKKSNHIESKPYYINKGFNIADISTEEEVLDLTTEEYNLKDRQRAIVNNPSAYSGFMH
ncbi:TraB/GumN family protein [Arenibacter sp. BSSL-BM3]|uniref:TraB/GumN family protein n=1 Tax=Arenibacter arenosicollis TaxID=2762274 RepID=A0ABR7QKI1_9FLAO|nr:TraB/GumN family protein [Arenibacter arenosicollis]MBC8767445.1 TraB/GumN family protein [Arenibacter arenosicollis]